MEGPGPLSLFPVRFLKDQDLSFPFALCDADVFREAQVLKDDSRDLLAGPCCEADFHFRSSVVDDIVMNGLWASVKHYFTVGSKEIYCIDVWLMQYLFTLKR